MIPYSVRTWCASVLSEEHKVLAARMSSNSASPPLFEDDKQQPYTSEQHDSNDITPTTLAIPSVSWYKDPGLRRLYMMMPILFLGSTTNGYDGSLLNGLQTMDAWQSCTFPSPVNTNRERA